MAVIATPDGFMSVRESDIKPTDIVVSRTKGGGARPPAPLPLPQSTRETPTPTATVGQTRESVSVETLRNISQGDQTQFQRKVIGDKNRPPAPLVFFTREEAEARGIYGYSSAGDVGQISESQRRVEFAEELIGMDKGTSGAVGLEQSQLEFQDVKPVQERVKGVLEKAERREQIAKFEAERELSDRDKELQDKINSLSNEDKLIIERKLKDKLDKNKSPIINYKGLSITIKNGEVVVRNIGETLPFGLQKIVNEESAILSGQEFTPFAPFNFFARNIGESKAYQQLIIKTKDKPILNKLLTARLSERAAGFFTVLQTGIFFDRIFAAGVKGKGKQATKQVQAKKTTTRKTFAQLIDELAEELGGLRREGNVIKTRYKTMGEKVAKVKKDLAEINKIKDPKVKEQALKIYKEGMRTAWGDEGASAVLRELLEQEGITTPVTTPKPKMVGGEGLTPSQLPAPSFQPIIDIQGLTPTLKGAGGITGAASALRSDNLFFTAQAPRQSNLLGTIQLLDTAQKEKLTQFFFQPQVTQQKFIQDQGLKLLSTQSSLLDTKLGQDMFFRSSTSTRPTGKNIKKLRGRLGDLKLPKGVTKTKLVEELVKVSKKKKGLDILVGMKIGKQRVIGKNLPPFKALKLARAYVDKNIEASFRLKKTGKTTRKKDIEPFNVGKKFRPSKKNPLFVVEKTKYRLDSPTEKKQMKIARRYKLK